MRKKTRKLALVMLMLMFLSSFTLLAPFEAQAYLGDRTLRSGMQGYDVLQLQRDLNYLNYPLGNYDGVFGRKTQKAVLDFQRDHQLPQNGIVGPLTSRSIIEQVSKPAAATQMASTTPATPSRGYLSFASAEMNDLVRLVYGEARGEPFVGQVAVAAVVLNRVSSQKFGGSIREVIYEPGAFTAVDDGQMFLQPNSQAYQAVQAAIKGWDPTGGALYYWNPATATNKWVWSRSIITQIGRHIFAR